MRPGARNQKITFQLKTEGAKDEFNKPAITWPDVLSTWAKVTDIKGNERYTGDQFVGKSVVMFEILQRASFRPNVADHRIAYNGLYYDIHDVRQIEESNLKEGWAIDASARSEGAIW